MVNSTATSMVENIVDEIYSDDIVRDVLEGLTSRPRSIPSKYFYDDTGSELFERICRLTEYYPTRTEISILREIAPLLASRLVEKDIVELGSGSDYKIRTILDAANPMQRSAMRYIPVDISQAAVEQASAGLQQCYPELDICGVIADFTCQLDTLASERDRMLFFLGSTIGNLEEDEAISFLSGIAGNMSADDELLVGFDMVKPVDILEAAYNDADGVTADFNRNILEVINCHLDGDFDPGCFDHLAFFNQERSRVEMHLRANCDCRVTLRAVDTQIDFHEGETIHTENSRKFSLADIDEMASRSGLAIMESHTDPRGWFCLAIMKRRDVLKGAL